MATRMDGIETLSSDQKLGMALEDIIKNNKERTQKRQSNKRQNKFDQMRGITTEKTTETVTQAPTRGRPRRIQGSIVDRRRALRSTRFNRPTNELRRNNRTNNKITISVKSNATTRTNPPANRSNPSVKRNAPRRNPTTQKGNNVNGNSGSNGKMTLNERFSRKNT